MDEVAENVFRLHGTHVNAVLVRAGRDLTVIDGGWQRDATVILRAIRELGHHPSDVRGIVLTHAHLDHLGVVNPIHHRARTPVYCHSLEVPHARGDYLEQASPADLISRLGCHGMLPWALRVIRTGGLRRIEIPQVEPFPRQGALDLPGSPVPVLCPGHTSGHTAYHLPEVGVLVVGDALVTGHPLSRDSGPQLLPSYFHPSPERALSSLEVLEDLDAELIVAGHGEPWRGTPREAVARARDHTEQTSRRSSRCR